MSHFLPQHKNLWRFKKEFNLILKKMAIPSWINNQDLCQHQLFHSFLHGIIDPTHGRLDNYIKYRRRDILFALIHFVNFGFNFTTKKIGCQSPPEEPANLIKRRVAYFIVNEPLLCLTKCHPIVFNFTSGEYLPVKWQTRSLRIVK